MRLNSSLKMPGSIENQVNRAEIILKDVPKLANSACDVWLSFCNGIYWNRPLGSISEEYHDKNCLLNEQH